MKEKIKEIVESMGFYFKEGDVYTLSQFLKRVEQLPAVLYVSPINAGGQITESGFVKERIEPILFFVDSDKLDQSGEDTNRVIERMRCAVKEFILKLNESRVFDPVESWTCRDIIKDMNIFCSGVSVSLSLTKNNGLCK